ncbi:MAG: hypothetical protein ACFE9R_16845 [Candidatus Hermodarchaeota archaeon]
MSEEDEKKRISERKREILEESLEQIKEELEEQLEEISEEMEDANQELKEEREEIIEQLHEAIEDLEDEKEDLLEEGVDLNEIEAYVDKMRNVILAGIRVKVERHMAKISRKANKFSEKAKKKMDKAERKAAKRINISVEPDMSEDWKDWAEGLGTSVSELVRKSMEFVKDNIGDIKKLEKMGEYLEELGGDIEKSLKESGIEDLGRNLKMKTKYPSSSPTPPPVPSPPIKVIITDADKDVIKKRIQGIIKLHKSIPIDKLALAMNKKVEDAEKIIYELAGEGLDGSLEEGVFKYTGDIDDVIERFDKMVDEM